MCLVLFSVSLRISCIRVSGVLGSLMLLCSVCSVVVLDAYVLEVASCGTVACACSVYQRVSCVFDVFIVFAACFFICGFVPEEVAGRVLLEVAVVTYGHVKVFL